MNKRLVDRIPFAKILLVLVAIFILSLGMCGATLVFGGSRGVWSNLLDNLVVAEMAGMVLSAAALVLTAFLWVTLALIGASATKVSQPQRLLNERDDTKLDNRD